MKTSFKSLFKICFIALSVTMSAGCGKKNGSGSSDTDYYVKFSVSGNQFNFKGYPYASFSQSDGMYLGGIGSSQDQGVGTKNVVSVTFGSLASIKEGTYSGLLNPPAGGATPAVFFAYIDKDGKTFGNLYNDNATNKVTITSISSGSVKGNFSGKIYDVLQPGSSPLEFSGDFNVKRVN